MRMKHYAMVPINWKLDKDNNMLIRRVLVSYKFKKMKKGAYYLYLTKVIDKDDYFKDINNSHKYIFKNRGYRLLTSNLDYETKIYKFRRYHIATVLGVLLNNSYMFASGGKALFDAPDDEHAKKVFKEREELR